LEDGGLTAAVAIAVAVAREKETEKGGDDDTR